MAAKAPVRTSLKATTYSLIIILAVLLHMLLDGDISLGSQLSLIISEPTGIFQFIGAVFSWIFSQLFSAYGAIFIGLIVAMEFIVIPLSHRYKYLTVKSNILMSIIGAIYFLLLLRIFAEAFL